MLNKKTKTNPFILNGDTGVGGNTGGGGGGGTLGPTPPPTLLEILLSLLGF